MKRHSEKQWVVHIYEPPNLRRCRLLEGWCTADGMPRIDEFMKPRTLHRCMKIVKRLQCTYAYLIGDRKIEYFNIHTKQILPEELT